MSRARKPKSVRWEVISYQGPTGDGVGPLWLCRCRECGFHQVCNSHQLRRGRPRCERCKWTQKRDAAESLRVAAERAAEASLSREEEFLAARNAAHGMLAQLESANAYWVARLADEAPARSKAAP